MADITFSCPRLSATVRRHVAPQARKMSATSNIGLTARPLLSTQALQRTDDFVQQIGGDLCVERCRFKLLVAKQHLNHTDIHLLFEQVRGETVAQRMHRYAFIDLCGFGRSPNRAIQLPWSQRVNRVQSWK